MPERLVPDDQVPGAWQVRFGDTSQSWVDPARPDLLVFEYVQHIAMLLDHSVMPTPPQQRLRFIHVGGGGLTIPRWVAHRRPGSAQIVCEPDRALTEEVRRRIPLPPRSGIKVRDVDGRTGVREMPDGYADVVVVDAFRGAQVPAELASGAFLDEARRIGRGAALAVINVTDRAPFDWAKRVAAGLVARWPHVLVGAEAAVHKGRRFGNLLLVGSVERIDVEGVRRESNRLPFGYQWLEGRALQQWLGGACEFSDADTLPSPEPGRSGTWFT